jgi:signal transduction histidine kinase/DNA-binding response OmpR family regulator
VKNIERFRQLIRAPIRSGIGLGLVMVILASIGVIIHDTWRDMRASEAAAAALVLCTLVIIGLGARYRRRLDRVRERLADREAAMDHKSAELEAALDHVSQGIMMIDRTGTVAVMNRRTATLLDLPERFVGTRPKFSDILAYQWETSEFGRDGEMLDPEVRAFIRSGGLSARPEAYERTRPNGMVLEVRSTPLPDGGVVRTYADITPRKQTETALAEARDKAEAANRARSAFLAMMSHEIRTPLNGVIGLADVVMDTRLDDEQRRCVTALRESAGHLLQIINDVLDYSELDAGRMKIETLPLDLAQILHSTIDLLAPAAREKGLRIDLAIEPDVPQRLVGDSRRLRQILLNLVGNAVKFTSEGSVRIGVSRGPGGPGADAHAITFAIRDTGIGMAPDGVAKLFQEFSQLDGSMSRRFGGTGLGLAICRKLVDQMGGSIEVESELGCGTVFTVTLPFGVDESSAAPSPPGALDRDHAGRPTARRLRILLVEDNLTNLLVATKLLENIGHTVDAVGNGLEAVRAVQTRGYDLVLMDVMMPVMDGLTACREIRKLPGPVGAIPIVAVTANARKDDMDAAKAAGMNDFTGKPITHDRLQRVIERVMNDPPHVAAPSAVPDAGPMVFDRLAMDRFAEEIGSDNARGLLAIFFDDAQARIERMMQCVDNRVDLTIDAHSLKSAAATFGLMVVSAQAARLEMDAAEMPRPEIVAALDRLADAFAQARCSVPPHYLETIVDSAA